MTMRQKVLMMLTLAMGTLLGLPGCNLTRKNAIRMRAEEDPKREFRHRLGTVFEGDLWRQGPYLLLALPDFFSREKGVRLVFPAQSSRPGRQVAWADILPMSWNANFAPGPAAHRVEVMVLDGLFDASSDLIQKETQFSAATGLPARLVLGLQVERREPGIDVMTYMVGYKPIGQRRYITAAAATELPWLKRSRAAQARRSLLYPLTVPMDAATVPAEAAAVLLMHPGKRKP